MSSHDPSQNHFVAQLLALIKLPRDSVKIAINVFNLFLLELKLARSSLAVIAFLTIFLVLFLVSAWVCLIWMLILFLNHFIASLAISVAIVFGLNIILSIIVLVSILKYQQNLRFNATRSQLNVR